MTLGYLLVCGLYALFAYYRSVALAAILFMNLLLLFVVMCVVCLLNMFVFVTDLLTTLASTAMSNHCHNTDVCIVC